MAPDLTITIQTFSDTVCPWSYIGKKNLDNAIDMYKQEHPEVNFEVTWNPFYLNPEAKVSGETPTPSSQPCYYQHSYSTRTKIKGKRKKKSPEEIDTTTLSKARSFSNIVEQELIRSQGYNKKDYYASMFGPARAALWFDRVNDRARSLGLSINWDGLCGNTRDSHVLLLLAQKQYKQDQEDGGGDDYSADGNKNILRDTQDALFDGVFGGGRDVSDRDFLAEVALEVGLCESDEELFAVLDNPLARAEADAMDRAAKKIARITAAPSYVVQGRYSVGGQQNSEVFLGLFDRIRLEGSD